MIQDEMLQKAIKTTIASECARILFAMNLLAEIFLFPEEHTSDECAYCLKLCKKSARKLRDFGIQASVEEARDGSLVTIPTMAEHLLFLVDDIVLPKPQVEIITSITFVSYITTAIDVLCVLGEDL